MTGSNNKKSRGKCKNDQSRTNYNLRSSSSTTKFEFPPRNLEDSMKVSVPSPTPFLDAHFPPLCRVNNDAVGDFSFSSSYGTRGSETGSVNGVPNEGEKEDQEVAVEENGDGSADSASFVKKTIDNQDETPTPQASVHVQKNPKVKAAGSCSLPVSSSMEKMNSAGSNAKENGSGSYGSVVHETQNLPASDWKNHEENVEDLPATVMKIHEEKVEDLHGDGFLSPDASKTNSRNSDENPVNSASKPGNNSNTAGKLNSNQEAAGRKRVEASGSHSNLELQSSINVAGKEATGFPNKKGSNHAKKAE